MTTASDFSTTTSGVAFLVGEGDFEREAEDISVEQNTRGGDRGRGRVKKGECTTLGTRWRGREMHLPGATTGDATAAILKLVDGRFHLRCWLIFRGLSLEIRTTWTTSKGLVRGRSRCSACKMGRVCRGYTMQYSGQVCRGRIMSAMQKQAARGRRYASMVHMVPAGGNMMTNNNAPIL